VIDATILIPTYRHAALLPYSVRSALAQDGASIELFVVGDGVEDDTRAALEPFLADPRVRFFDLPKGERNGELNRHTALEEAGGRIVCYLSDDDLLLPCHVATMLELLEGADLAHGAPFVVEPGGALAYIPFDLAQEPQQNRLRTGVWNAIGLTGAAHTLAAYRRLPWGWRPGPKDVWSDLHMWRQFLDLPDFRGVTGTELTFLNFPNPVWSQLPHDERVAALVSWSATISDPEARSRLARQARRTRVARTAAVDLYAHELELRGDNLDEQVATLREQLADLRAVMASLESSRTWRLRNRLLGLRPVRALAARLPAAR
jgi:hypothetical protein